MFKEDLKQFIKKQLEEMADNIVKNSSENIRNRLNNPFRLFDGYEEKYMAIGRSLDSQLGTRLQKIAFYCARYRYGFLNVPNIIVMKEKDRMLKVEFLSYPLDKGMTQYLYWDGQAADYLSSSCKKLYSSSKKRIEGCTYEFKDIDIDKIKKIIMDQDGKIPIDLFFINDKDAYAYEIKAGGNLDTKNKIGNIEEINRLGIVFSMFGNNKSKFATCYNNMGEGNSPVGSIFSILDDEHKVIGKSFWEEVLPLDEITYYDFIKLYSEASGESKVRDIIVHGC